MTTPEIVIIITTASTAIVTIVNSIAAGWGRKEVREKAEEAKQVTKEIHEDIVNKVAETTKAVDKVADGGMTLLTEKIDSLGLRVGNIETWMIAERTARTRTTDPPQNSNTH